MNYHAWSGLAVRVIARAAVEGCSIKRPSGMPRRRWQRVRHGRRWAKVVQREVQSIAYVQRLQTGIARRWGV